MNLNDLTFEVEKDTGEFPTLKVKGIAATFYFNDSMKKAGAAPAAGAAPGAVPAVPAKGA